MNSKLKKILLSSVIGLGITLSSSLLESPHAHESHPRIIKEKADYKKHIKELKNKYPFLTKPGIDAAINHALPAAKFNNINPLEIIDKTISITGSGYSHSALKYAVPAALNKKLDKDQIISSLNQIMEITNNKPNFVFKFGYKQALEQYKKDNENLEDVIKGLGITSKYLGNSLIFLSKDTDKLDYSEISNKESFAEQYTLMLNNTTENTSKESLEGMAHCMNESHRIEEEIHEGKDEIREKIGKNTDFSTKYYLISKANNKLYTTSFYHLYDNFPKNSIDSVKSIDSTKTYWGDYLTQMGSMNKAKEILEKDSLFYLKSFKKAIEEYGESDPSKSIKKGVYLTNSSIEFYNNEKYNELQKNLEEFLLKRYENSDSIDEKSILAYFIKHNKNPVLDRTKKLNKKLPEIPSPEIPEEFLNKDTIALKAYYFPGEEWYSASVSQFTNPPYNMKIKKQNENETILEKKLSNKKILKMNLTKDLGDVIETIQGGGYDIISHRSHSYNLDKTFSYPEEDTKKILFLGSCNSFRNTPEVQEKYPQSFLISDKNTGKGSVNNEITYNMMEKLANKTREWKDLKSEFSEKEGIIFPHEKNQLILRYLERMKKIDKNSE